MRSLRAARVLAMAILVAACAATSNPDRDQLRPMASTATAADAPQGVADARGNSGAISGSDLGARAASNSEAPLSSSPVAGSSLPTNPAGSSSSGDALSGSANVPQGSESGAQSGASSNAAKPAPALLLGRVGGEPLEVAEFLRRLWIHDGNTSRDVIEQMVFARIVMFEASRLGMELRPADVDSAVAKAVAALEKRLADKGSKLTLDEHIERNLELEPALYRASMRNDAIVSLLAERCVRCWEYESGLCRVRISEFRERPKLDAALAELAAGKPFEAVAAAHGLGEDEQAGYTRVPIVRAESQELARVAFATAVGDVGGPLEQSGAWLMFKVDSRDDGGDVRWAVDADRVEASLERDALQNVEYVQWRAAMTRRYQLDLGPFLETVTGRKP